MKMSLSSYNLEEICFLANVAMVLSVNPVQLIIYVHLSRQRKGMVMRSAFTIPIPVVWHDFNGKS